MAGENHQGKPNQQGGGEPGILDDLKSKAGEAAAQKAGQAEDAGGDAGEGNTGSGEEGTGEGEKFLGRFESQEAAKSHLEHLESKVKDLESKSSESEKALKGLFDKKSDDGKPAAPEGDQKKKEFMEKASKVFDSNELEILSEMLSLQSQTAVEQRVGPVEQELEQRRNQETINAIKEIPDWDKYVETAGESIKAGMDPLAAFQLAAAREGAPLTKEQAEQRANEQRLLKRSSQAERGSDVSSSGFAQSLNQADKGDSKELEKAIGLDPGPDRPAKRFFGVT